MQLAIILGIICTSLMTIIHIFVFIAIKIWRLKHFVKCLHNTMIGYIFWTLSALYGVLLPIGGLTFLNGGTEGAKALMSISLLICPPLLIVAIKNWCFCIYIDGKYVIKKTILNAIQIDLKDPETIIRVEIAHNKLIDNIGILSKDNKAIWLNEKFISGNVSLFLSDCETIHSGK